uniref:Phosphatidylinositol N-acetylglucosaminyltransferase subunit gpi15 n=1 Tax=Zeugodacus cucurbitae TaxID=28588 RepID=A0A0A1XHQ6_ZEUCU
MSSSAECTKQIYTYQSLGQRYSGHTAPDLQLTVYEYGKDSIELELTNLQYASKRYQKIKHICMIIIIYIIYVIMVSKDFTPLKGHILCDLTFLLWLLYRILNLLSLIQTEKVIMCLDLALQCHTVRFLRRTSNLFIPASNIYDIVINEVIEDVSETNESLHEGIILSVCSWMYIIY